MIKKATDFFGKLILFDLQKIKVNAWIGGGCLRDFFSGVEISEINDIDVYTDSEKNLRRIISYCQRNGGVIQYQNNNVVEIQFKLFVLELHKFYYTDPQQCVDVADTTISSAFISNVYTDLGDDLMFYSLPSFFMDLSARQIVFHYIWNPVFCLTRLQKFIIKGFTADYKQMETLNAMLFTLHIQQAGEIKPDPIETKTDTNETTTNED